MVERRVLNRFGTNNDDDLRVEHLLNKIDLLKTFTVEIGDETRRQTDEFKV